MKINNSQALKDAILELERKKVIQESVLKHQFHETTNSLKPTNMIKTAFHNATHAPGFRGSLFKAATGIGIGLLTKNMWLGTAMPIIDSLINSTGPQSQSSTQSQQYSSGSKKAKSPIAAYGVAILKTLFKKKKTV